jgi:DNA polymerase elongation subunit (family B)
MPTQAPRLAFDIETGANRDREADLPDPEVAIGNLKDPEKIAAKQGEAKTNQVAKMALDPHFSRILCASVAMRIDGDIVAQTMFRDRANEDTDAAERQVIEWLHEHVATTRGRVLTYNGAGFDVPYINRRCMILNMPPIRIEANKYRVRTAADDHLDLFQALTEDGPATICSRSLKFFVREFLHVECPYGDPDKGELGRLFDAGQLELIEQICSWDAAALLALGEHVEKYL